MNLPKGMMSFKQLPALSRGSLALKERAIIRLYKAALQDF
jgi:hypothetical protein